MFATRGPTAANLAPGFMGSHVQQPVGTMLGWCAGFLPADQTPWRCPDRDMPSTCTTASSAYVRNRVIPIHTLEDYGRRSSFGHSTTRSAHPSHATKTASMPALWYMGCNGACSPSTGTTVWVIWHRVSSIPCRQALQYRHRECAQAASTSPTFTFSFAPVSSRCPSSLLADYGLVCAASSSQLSA